MSARVSLPVSRRLIASRFWCGVSLGGRHFLPARHSPRPAFAGARTDQIALEFRRCARSVFAPLATSRKTFLHPALGGLAPLGVNALAVRRYPRVAVFHASLMAVTYAKEKPFWINGLIFLHNS